MEITSRLRIVGDLNEDQLNPRSHYLSYLCNSCANEENGQV